MLQWDAMRSSLGECCMFQSDAINTRLGACFIGMLLEGV